MRKVMLLLALVAMMVVAFAPAAVAAIKSGDNGPDTLRGTRSADQIAGWGGPDDLYGKAGGDDLYGGKQNDDIFGQVGFDDLTGGLGEDDLSGGFGNDEIFAVDGDADNIDCGPQRDTVWADSQDDVAADCENVNVGAAL